MHRILLIIRGEKLSLFHIFTSIPEKKLSVTSSFTSFHRIDKIVITHPFSLYFICKLSALERHVYKSNIKLTDVLQLLLVQHIWRYKTGYNCFMPIPTYASGDMFNAIAGYCIFQFILTANPSSLLENSLQTIQ